MKNKLGSQIYYIVYKFILFYKIRKSGLPEYSFRKIYSNTIRPLLIQHNNTQSTEFCKVDFSKYIKFSNNISPMEILRSIQRICCFRNLLNLQLSCSGSEFQHCSVYCEFQYNSLFRQGLS